jgi:hypothetical protein
VKLPADAADKLLRALELQEIGLNIVWKNFEARFPDASEQEIDAMFLEWQLSQPTFDEGNPDVVVGTWPRRR